MICRLSDMLIVMKNRLSRMLWNGLIFVFSLCWKFDFDSMMLVRKEFMVMERFVSLIVMVVVIIMNSVVVIMVLCVLVWVMIWKSGLSRYLLVISMVVMMVMVIVKFCSWLGVVILFCWCVSSGMSVRSGMMVRFWKSSSEKVCWLCLVDCLLLFLRICSVKVVEESVSLKFVISVFC